jgi:hypothetical protein
LIAEVVSGWRPAPRFQTIKAGRRKLSGKKSSKTLTLAGELPIHISDSGAGRACGYRHVTQNAAFFYRWFPRRGV